MIGFNVAFVALLCTLASRMPLVNLSISLGTCRLSCNDETVFYGSNETIRKIYGRPGKGGPTGPKGDPGTRGSKGEVGSSGLNCACSKYEAELVKLERLVENRFRDCADVKRVISTNGISVIFPFSDANTGIHAYCDQTTDDGGWIVIQRRVDGTENFYRGWNDYVTGFGRKEGEFWMGLEIIHKLTTNGTWELRVDLSDFEENEVFAGYRSFSVAGSEQEYKLLVSGYHGSAGNSLEYHNNMRFSTKDRDNDPRENSCAEQFKGAWWYRGCHLSNLNGMYNGTGAEGGVTWYKWREMHTTLKRAEMKIRKTSE